MVTRDEYVTKMKARLDEWNDEIDRLEAKLSEASDETRKRLEPYLEKARESRDQVVAKFGEVKDAGEASFEAKVDQVEHVWKTFKQSVNYFKSQL
jgi:predicted  nucleic acid-binding Zn-ribbon protein